MAGWNKGTTSSTSAAGLVGLGLDLLDFRFEGLAEVGGRRYANFLDDPGVINPPSAYWFPYAGIRPGVSYRFGTVLKFMVGVWAYGRWDLLNKDIVITTSQGSTTYKLGGSSYGASLRFGLSF